MQRVICTRSLPLCANSSAWHPESSIADFYFILFCFLTHCLSSPHNTPHVTVTQGSHGDKSSLWECPPFLYTLVSVWLIQCGPTQISFLFENFLVQYLNFLSFSYCFLYFHYSVCFHLVFWVIYVWFTRF